ncbi:MAG TPA: N-acetyl-D-Glu racemase DgcA [Steroidobacteraceae bacterium]|nr:N-acetyl-D-Glu racemase DgcA [Steroidobacteraceae bacterium]
MQVEFHRVDWPYTIPFRIAYRASTVAETVQVQLTDGPHVGRGEALGVSYRGETIDSILADLVKIKDALCAGVPREELASLLPAGGARNAVDCALWDLEAKRMGMRAWELAGFPSLKRIATDYTIGLDTPKATAEIAASSWKYPILKLKLDGKEDLERVLAVRSARPDAEIIVDANQAWTDRQLRDWPPRFAQLGVKLIEQPLPAGGDHALLGCEHPIPLCADESCQTTESLAELAGKYEYINIKLDKTGGLTEALRLAREAQRQGYKLMVGCMAGSSLSMAPALIVAQLCDFADLDGPLLAVRDISPAIEYNGHWMNPPERGVWG